MKGVLLFIFAITGSWAFPSPAFPEDVRGNARIVSGWEAEDGEVPYQLSLRMVSPVGGVTACGATLIHNEWALTAAHCTATRVTVVIRAGGANLTRPAIIFDTTEYYNHPLYIEALQSVVQPHDLGLIKFGRFIEYTDNIQPVRLQPSVDKDRNYKDIRLQASGWGRTWTNGASPEVLNWVYLKGVANEDCFNAFGGSSIIVASTICAGGYNVSSQSTCQGDSGGPLVVVDDDGGITQVGISSFVSSSGCHTDFPAGFIRPGHYHAWFSEVTGLDFDWIPSEEATTEGPQVTQTEPVVTEAETEVTTAEPEVTEAEPEVTEAEPEVTEAEPEVTEAEPEVTEAEPEFTTAGTEY